jgi:polyisoprenoid-binding protein YceI
MMKIWAALFGLALALSGGVWFLLGYTAGAARAVNEVNEPSTAMRYQLVPSRSRFMVQAHRGGLAWFKGHDHFIGVKEFSGVAELTPDALNPASLQMSIRADSLAETSDVFTPQQKGIIKKELEEIVLETAKYPEITFRSTEVKGDLKNGAFNVKIGGDITLHGVTRHIVIPATVTVQGDTMHAIGKFSLNRGDFKVKATSAFHGMVRVKGKLSFTFDIIGERI